MRIIYLDCGMGAAGDMLTGALLELLPDPDAFLDKLNHLGIPQVEFKTEKLSKAGILGTKMTVLVHGEEEGQEHELHHKHHHTHHHTKLADIHQLVSALELSESAREKILKVYAAIAEAESHVHGVPVEEIHFHEVGNLDALADITAVCLLLEELAVEKIVASPICVGFGQVECAHGILPVPAPATAYILRGLPVYSGKIEGELCTPTGAALLKTFVSEFRELPLMKIQSIGYGMGKKDFSRANCVRAFLGESGKFSDTVYELSCNLDDMTAEDLAFAIDRLYEGGANEVYTSPIGMKKSRPGVQLSVLCSEEKKDDMLQLIFRYTSTIGVREDLLHRHILSRHMETIYTPYGEVRKKVSSGFGIVREKLEADDIAKIAKEKNISPQEARKLVEK